VQRAFYGEMMKTKVVGRALVPQNRPCIVVANHTSHLDLGAIRHALGVYGEDVVTLGAKDYFFEDVRRHWFANFTNVVPVERTGTRDGLDRAGEILDRGKTLLLFPEGTRSTSGLISEFKPGVGYLALKHGVDVLPVYVGGAFESMPKGAFVPRTRELAVRIGAPLPIATLRRKTEGLRRDEAARVIARIAQRAVESLREGAAFDLEAWDARGDDAPRVHPMQALFEELPLRFIRDAVARKTVWYFTLGDDENLKWTVQAEPQRCTVTRGKPAGGADCVIKTSPAMIEKIIREGYAPAPAEFVSGSIKTSDVELLMSFASAFELGAQKRRDAGAVPPHPEAGE
jgi:long-chain acyl-CoA synthetase